MKFVERLKENRALISETWLKKTLETYPKDSVGFLSGQSDRFANPVGNTHSVAIHRLIEQLVSLDDEADYRAALTDLIKIRSVQDFTHTEAVSFVFFLKDIIRSALKKDLREDKSATENLFRFDAAVDRMALQAFEVYCGLREKLYAIRVDEVKRNVASLIRQTGFVDEDFEK